MTHRLILVRHAKSSWDNPLDSDHARPLNPRGTDAAGRIGRWLSAHGYLPDQALVSDAQRCRETWEHLLPCLPQPVPVQYVPALYHASAERMHRCLAEAQGTCVLMLGHNPGIGDFAGRILRARPAHPAFGRYPTAATLVADFKVDTWGALDWHSGHVVDFIVPRDLDEAVAI